MRPSVLCKIRHLVLYGTPPPNITASLLHQKRPQRRSVRAEIKKLQNDMKASKKTIKDEIKNEIKGELEQAQLAAFNQGVSRQERTAMNLVVHGLPQMSMEAFLGLLDTLQVPEKDKIVLKRITGLGKGSNVKTCLVELGDSAQRNAILSSLGPNKVPAGIKIDKDCPLPPYL